MPEGMTMETGIGRADYSTATVADFDRLAIYENIVIVAPEREEVSKGGIVLPDTGDAQKIRWGKVVAVGPGRWDAGVFVKTVSKVGQRVMFGRYQSAGEPIKLNGNEYLLFREGDLVAREAQRGD